MKHLVITEKLFELCPRLRDYIIYLNACAELNKKDEIYKTLLEMCDEMKKNHIS